MRSDFKTLLACAAFLTAEQKAMYGAIFDNLDEARQAELTGIIQDGVNECDAVGVEVKAEQHKAIDGFVDDCDKAIKKEFTLVKSQELRATKQDCAK